MVGLETSVPDAVVLAQPFWWAPTRVLALIGSATFALFFYLFPSGSFVPPWTRWLALAWTMTFAASAFLPDTALNINNQPIVLVTVFIGGFFASFVYSQVYRYRRVSTPTERLQTKWVVAAVVVGITGFCIALGTIMTARDPSTQVPMSPLYLLADFGFAAFGYVMPLALGIAVLRYRLWDIDILIRRTLTYALVTALLALVFFGSVIVLQQLFANLTGSGQNELVTVLSTLAIAALFVPLRNRIQSFIDRGFYRKKYDAQQVLNDFATTVRDETDLEKLTARLMQVVDETMRPRSVSLWLNTTPENQRVRPRGH
jgi:hypothetical protein